MKKLMLCSAMLVSSVAMADTYQLNYGWTAPAWIPSDTPSYGMRYKLAGGTPVILADSTTPGGSLTLAMAPGTMVEVCPQNKNGTLVMPTCEQPGDWIAVGAAPYPPTMPPQPSGFSATIIRTGN